MSEREAVAKALTVIVMTIFAVTVLPNIIGYSIAPSSDSLIGMVEAVALNWWIPIAKGSPLLFVLLVFLFNWAGVEDLLEV